MRNGLSRRAWRPGSLLPNSIALSAALAVGLVVASSAVDPAKAGIEYPWCAIYSESTVGATNCGFSTLAQCRATIAGIGGMCQPNPAYPSPPPRPQPKRPHQPR